MYVNNRIGIPVLNLSVTFRFVYILLYFIKQSESLHVAIIGAGAAGLNAIRYCIDPNYPNITCDVYEQTNHVGGTWYYTDQVDIDRDGTPVHTSMYENLRTNIPKETMKFIDFPFPNLNMSFIPHSQVYEYLVSYGEHFKVLDHIRFHTQVTKVSPILNNRWNITVRDVLSGEEKTLDYDAVMICTGHFSTPNYPNLPGEEHFKGSIIHSHRFRTTKPYINQTVLILGLGSSGIDIGYMISSVAKKVYLSHNRQKHPNYYPKNVEEVVGAVKVYHDGVILSDNKAIQVDSIIYCTGYLYDFPFLTKECKIKFADNCVEPLFRQLINIEIPTMAFIGLQRAILPFPLFDFQNRFFFNYLNGTIRLPSKMDMYKEYRANMDKMIKMYGKKKYVHIYGIAMETQYFAELAFYGNLKPIPPVYIKLHTFVTGKNYTRHSKFKILDDENFIKI